MKKKRMFTGLLVAFAVVAVAVVSVLSSRPSRTGRVGEREPQSGKMGERFVVDTLLPMTPVKQQGRSPLCWVYAMLATLESDRIAQGDSVNLSPVYVARQMLEGQARRYYLSQGKTGLSLRGMMTMTLDIIAQHGLQPYDYYHKCNDADWNPLLQHVVKQADGAIAKSMGLADFEQQLGDLLDKELDYEPRYVHMLGAEYTNEEFGRSIVMPGDWQALTSFTHHPFGDRFALEVADNQLGDMFLNVPIDTLMAAIERSLGQGHPVCWEGDISEPGFSFEKGVAEIAGNPGNPGISGEPGISGNSGNSGNPGDSSSQSLRQQQFEHFQTTDDHCMALVGLARDGQGRRYYIAKNSWGKKNPYGGLMFLSEDYVRLKTIAVVVRRSLLSQQNAIVPLE